MDYDKDLLKEIYGNRFKEEFINHFGLYAKNKKYFCCFHDDGKIPNLSYDEKTNVWKCFACGEVRGDIYEHLMIDRGMNFKQALEWVANEVGENMSKTKSFKTKTMTEYKKPNIKTKELTNKHIEYMIKRGITKETLDYWGVKAMNWKGTEVYVFSYFLEKELIHVSYRGIGKGAIKGGSELDTQAILWGMDNIDKTKPLVIVEGQPDAMIVSQSGYKNVVSVPSGSNNLNWITQCWEWLKDVDSFIVWADNDLAGLKMANEIKNRLENVKVITSDIGNDPNELHYKLGPKKVLELINKAINEVPDGVINVSELEYKYYDDKTDEVIETGFSDYDSVVEDWKTGELTVVFGRNGEGKTTYISQVIGHCLNQKVPTFLYSGELSGNKIQEWLYKQVVAGKKNTQFQTKTKYKMKYEIKPTIIKAVKKWHNENFFLYDRSFKKDADGFFKVVELAVKKYGIKLLVIDNLMAILEENADSILNDQANFTQKCKDFAVENNIHVVLLAHPNKGKTELQEIKGNLEKNDISGTGNISNKADNIIAIERVWDEAEEVDGILSSLKDREGGNRFELHFKFSTDTLRFYNDRCLEQNNYNWMEYLDADVDRTTFNKIKYIPKEKPPWE